MGEQGWPTLPALLCPEGAAELDRGGRLCKGKTAFLQLFVPGDLRWGPSSVLPGTPLAIFQAGFEFRNALL